MSDIDAPAQTNGRAASTQSNSNNKRDRERLSRSRNTEDVNMLSDSEYEEGFDTSSGAGDSRMPSHSARVKDGGAVRSGRRTPTPRFQPLDDALRNSVVSSKSANRGVLRADSKTSSNGFGYGLKSSTLDLAGKVVIVTGASSGIGAITAKRLASQGAQIVATARRKAKIADVVEDITSAGGDAFAVECDVTKVDSVDAMIKAVLDKYGKVNAAFLNSGVLSNDGEDIVGTEDLAGEIDFTFDVNVKGTANTLKAISNAIKKTSPEGGSIVYNSSVNHEVTTMSAVYAASKAASEVICLSAAAQLKKHNIRINIVRPGFTLPSEVVGALGPTDQLVANLGTKFNGTNRAIHGEEVANVVSFFVSDISLSVNGTALAVANGQQNSRGWFY